MYAYKQHTGATIFSCLTNLQDIEGTYTASITVLETPAATTSLRLSVTSWMFSLLIVPLPYQVTTYMLSIPYSIMYASYLESMYIKNDCHLWKGCQIIRGAKFLGYSTFLIQASCNWQVVHLAHNHITYIILFLNQVKSILSQKCVCLCPKAIKISDMICSLWLVYIPVVSQYHW